MNLYQTVSIAGADRKATMGTWFSDYIAVFEQPSHTTESDRESKGSGNESVSSWTTTLDDFVLHQTSRGYNRRHGLGTINEHEPFLGALADLPEDGGTLVVGSAYYTLSDESRVVGQVRIFQKSRDCRPNRIEHNTCTEWGRCVRSLRKSCGCVRRWNNDSGEQFTFTFEKSKQNEFRCNTQEGKVQHRNNRTRLEIFNCTLAEVQWSLETSADIVLCRENVDVQSLRRNALR